MVSHLFSPIGSVLIVLTAGQITSTTTTSWQIQFGGQGIPLLGKEGWRDSAGVVRLESPFPE